MPIGGWTQVGALPTVNKVVFVAAPHTSNWDGFWLLVYKIALDIDVHFLAKHTLFWWPLGSILRALGAIPIDRSISASTVQQVVDIFADREKFYFLSLTMLGKDEKHFDKFDRAGDAFFNGLESMDGMREAFPMLQTVRHLRRVAARKAELRLLFVRLVLEVVLAKDRMHQKERALIWTICTEFDIGRVELAQLEAMIRAQKGFRHSPAGDADAQRVRQAYRSLGVDESATNEEGVKADRRAINKSHPDKIASSNPDEAAVAAAEKRTREVRAA